MLRRGAAAAADHVQVTGSREVAEHPRHVLRRVVVAAELVRQAGVRVHADAAYRPRAPARRRTAAGLRRPSAQFSPITNGFACRTEFQKASVVWPGQRAAGGIRDRAGHHDRHRLAELIGKPRDGVERRPRIQRVEDGFHHQEIRAAGDQVSRRLAVGRHQLVEADVAQARVVHVRRQRGRAVGRARARRRRTAARPCARPPRRRPAGRASPRQVQFGDQRLQAVVSLRWRRRIEAVGLDDVGPGLEEADGECRRSRPAESGSAGRDCP